MKRERCEQRMTSKSEHQKNEEEEEIEKLQNQMENI